MVLRWVISNFWKLVLIDGVGADGGMTFLVAAILARALARSSCALETTRLEVDGAVNVVMKG